MKMDRKNSVRELAEELRALRLLIREIGENYLAILRSEVAHVEEAVRNAEPGGKRMSRRISQAERLLQELRGLDVKPHKGRRRDLRQIEKLIERMAEVVDEW